MAQWGKGLETTKVGPVTVILFIALLGVFSAAAAGIGYLTHHLPGRSASGKPAPTPDLAAPKPTAP